MKFSLKIHPQEFRHKELTFEFDINETRGNVKMIQGKLTLMAFIEEGEELQVFDQTIQYPEESLE